MKISGLPPGMVAIPAMEWMWTESAKSFIELSQHLPPGSVVEIGRDSSSAAWNRNRLAERFLERRNLQWCLFLDSDMVAPIGTVPQLLSHNVDVVGGLCFARKPPFPAEFEPLPEELRHDFETLEADAIKDQTQQGLNAAWDRWRRRANGEGGGLKSVSWVGGGALMVRREILVAMPYPFFEQPVPGEGEDVLFCQKVRALGVPVYVDCDLVLGHLSTMTVNAKVALDFQVSAEGVDVISTMKGMYARDSDSQRGAREHGFTAAVEKMLLCMDE